MSTYRIRPYSPPRYRDPLRSSTGNVLSGSYEPPSSGHSSRSSVGNINNITYEAQPIRKTINAEGKKTEYVVRPRHNSTSAHDAKRPLSISTARNTSPTRRPSRISASPREILSAGIPRDSPTRLLQPSSALTLRPPTNRHQRHSSATRAELEGFESHRPRQDRQYHVRGLESPKQYYVSRSHPQIQADEDDWSYTGPREQFARDYPQRPRRDSHSRRERPVNAYESDREYSSRRDYGPPRSSNRQLVPIDRIEAGRYKTEFDSDPDRPHEASRRHNSLRAPILHQQHLRDEGYSSSRDDYDLRTHQHRYSADEGRRGHTRRESFREDDRERRKERERTDDHDRHRKYDAHEGKDRHRRKPRSRETSPERSNFKDIASGAISSLATAGTIGALLGRESKDKHSGPNDEEEKHHRRRRRHHDKEDGAAEDPDEHRRSRRQDGSSSESLEDRPRRRRHSKRRQSSGIDDNEDQKPVDSQRQQRPRSVSRPRPQSDDHERSERELVPAYDHHDDQDSLESRTISPGENADDRPRKVMLVEPEKKEEIKPKGILKPARQVPFPEDPNPIREGVAPLKDAKKDGIPATARWTKISRVLVNPAALEKANERFEERDDYVIVLRVLSRDEIQKLAEKTTQIRAAREEESERLRNQQRNRTNGHDSEFTDDEDGQHTLAIEAPPSTQTDFRSMTQTRQDQQYQPQPVHARSENASSGSLQTSYNQQA